MCETLGIERYKNNTLLKQEVFLAKIGEGMASPWISQDFGYVVTNLVNAAGLVPGPCDQAACQLDSNFGFWIWFGVWILP